MHEHRRCRSVTLGLLVNPGPLPFFTRHSGAGKTAGSAATAGERREQMLQIHRQPPRKAPLPQESKK